MAKRIQLKRTNGWKMPPNTVKVDRTTKWGNPFVIVRRRSGPTFRVSDRRGVVYFDFPTLVQAQALAVRLYLAYMNNVGRHGAIRDDGGAFLKILAKEELRGKDLACWCKPGDPCHADVLLELANK